jgi:wyosine [tRNA(Phe)-imidazoG37] synthetase (radical SAM superfamily)
MDNARPGRHIFGPVPSRRLGRSLGVDVVPFKTCTFDCIYCQLGRTTKKTMERQEWVPIEEILRELRGKLALEPDYITIGGSGEPTLYSRIGDLIDGIHTITDIPVAILTNGSLLWDEAVRDELSKADVVMPSLDAGTEVLFRTVNRPHPAIGFDRLLEGLIAFRRQFLGLYWLEVLLLSGYTAIEAEVKKIARTAAEIKPNEVHLNTCVRPPVEEYAYPVEWQRLVELADLFSPPAEVIADSRLEPTRMISTADSFEILQLLKRRPCTAQDIAAGLGIHPAEVVKDIESLIVLGLAEAKKGNRRGVYYVASQTKCVNTDEDREGGQK